MLLQSGYDSEKGGSKLLNVRVQISIILKYDLNPVI